MTSIGIRREPDVGSGRTGAEIEAGDTFEATEEVKGSGGQRYLKLKNDGGWVFTQGFAGEWIDKPIVEIVEAAKVTRRQTAQD